jgi:hypothetical protein
MIYKIQVNAALSALAICIILLHCIRDPIENSWKPQETDFPENNYTNMQSLVQESDGTFYFTSGDGIGRFDSADFESNNSPKYLTYPYRPLLFIDANNKAAAIANDGNIIVKLSHDSVNYIDLRENNIFSFPLKAINLEDGILWLCTQDGNICSWDGNEIKKPCRIWGPNVDYNGLETVGIFPVDSGFDVFTYNRFLLKHISCPNSRYGAIDGYGRISFESRYDSCVVFNVFRINKQFFIIAEVQFSDDNVSTGIFELTEFFNADLRIVLPQRPDGYIKTGDAVYFKGLRYICKITEERCIKIETTYELNGPLFLDRFNRPMLLYGPTRRIIPIDSIPGYY